MGARPLRRAIQKHVEDPVSELLIAAREEKIEAIEVRVGPEGLIVTAREREAIVQDR
jgi:ATP-dependent Clp protease ATP-binding subunit ClpB